MSFVVAEFLVRRVVDVAIEVRSCKDVLDNLARVPVPNLMDGSHPLRRTRCSGERLIIAELGTFPSNIAKLNGVDLTVEILMVGEGWGVMVGNERGSP